MMDIDYSEIVRVFARGRDPREMTLAQALREISTMTYPARLYASVLYRGSMIQQRDLRALYERQDFAQLVS